MNSTTSQVLIDRATLEHIVAALNEVDQHVDLKRYDTAPNEVLFDVVMAALTASRTALAQQEELRTCENCAVNDKSEHPKCMMCCGPNEPNTRYQPINTDKMDLHKQAYRNGQHDI